MKIYNGLILVFLLWFSAANAQNFVLTNGTQTQPEFIDSVKKYQAEEEAFVLDTADIKIAVNVYKYQVDQGVYNIINDNLIYNAIDELNEYFSPASIQFWVSAVNIIDDYNYARIVHPDTINEMVTLYSRAETINLYVANEVKLGGMLYYGYTYNPNEEGMNYIFIQRNYLSGKNLASLFGSYFGLLFTHTTIGGMELADGSNCDQSGDFICDTKADPDLNGKVDANCQYMSEIKDGSNNFYSPSVVNFMSNSPEICKCLFTDDQYKRLQFYYIKFRKYLW